MRKFAFLDLDMTLFDYSAAREGATLAALTAIDKKIPIDVQRTFEIVSRILIPYGDLLVDIDFPNFRRQWKSPELFALCLLLNDDKDLFGQLTKLKQPLSEILAKTHRVDGITVDFQRKLENRRSLKKNVEELGLGDLGSACVRFLDDSGHRAITDSAIEAFDHYLKSDVKLFDGTHELLHSLESNGFEIAILSEGDESVQKGKAEILGLNKLVNNIFVSSSCCRSEDLLNWLWSQSIKSENEKDQSLLQAISTIFTDTVPYSIKSPTWFRKVLHSMLLPKEDRSDFYESFGWLAKDEIDSHGPVHILLFGDRYDKDIYPALLAFKNAVTIRLLYGKYKEDYSRDAIKKRGLPEPAMTVDSVFAAAEFVEAQSKNPVALPAMICAPELKAEHVEGSLKAIEILETSIGAIPSQIKKQLDDLSETIRSRFWANTQN